MVMFVNRGCCRNALSDTGTTCGQDKVTNQGHRLANPVPCKTAEEWAPGGSVSLRRRDVLRDGLGLATMMPQWGAAAATVQPVIGERSILERIRGAAPQDLVFPDSFEGIWKVESVLKKVELPFGERAVPDMTSVRRAQVGCNTLMLVQFCVGQDTHHLKFIVAVLCWTAPLYRVWGYKHVHTTMGKGRH